MKQACGELTLTSAAKPHTELELLLLVIPNYNLVTYLLQVY